MVGQPPMKLIEEDMHYDNLRIFEARYHPLLPYSTRRWFCVTALNVRIYFITRQIQYNSTNNDSYNHASQVQYEQTYHSGYT